MGILKHMNPRKKMSYMFSSSWWLSYLLILPSKTSEVKKKGGKILFTAKAYNGRCILSWLSDCLLTALDSYPDHEVLVLTSAAMTLDLKFMVLMFFGLCSPESSTDEL